MTGEQSPGGPDQDLARLAEEARGLGLPEGAVFVVVGHTTGVQTTGEYAAIRWQDDRFVVTYRDRGESRIVLETTDFQEARSAFLTECVELASYLRFEERDEWTEFRRGR